MAVRYHDYYRTLGVERSASQDEIKKAFRELAKKWHPDANKGNDEAEKKFAEISNAYDILKDEKKRVRVLTCVCTRRLNGLPLPLIHIPSLKADLSSTSQTPTPDVLFPHFVDLNRIFHSLSLLPAAVFLLLSISFSP